MYRTRDEEYGRYVATRNVDANETRRSQLLLATVTLTLRCGGRGAAVSVTV